MWGYSEVGVVDSVGPGATGVAVDDVVWGIWGHRSHAVLPADRLAGHQLPGGLDPIVGTFDRVGAVALNAVLATGACVGESVAVFGLGVIGLLATQLLISAGQPRCWPSTPCRTGWRWPSSSAPEHSPRRKGIWRC